MDTPQTKYIITAYQLEKILWPEVKLPRLVIVALANSLNMTFEHFGIDSLLRQSHFLAQVIHESGGFVFSKEIWGPTKAQRRYEFKKTLGNTQPGDGEKFMGRGFIQITGRFNYQQISNYLGIDFVTHPEKLAEAPYNSMSAGWFWNNRRLNFIADMDDVEKVTRVINGGMNGFEERKKWLAKVKSVLYPASV